MKGQHLGRDHEDLYLKIGDVWETVSQALRITRKIYTIKENGEDYTIQMYGENGQLLNKGGLPLSAPTPPRALPLPSNLHPDTLEYMMTIKPGDELVESGTSNKVTGVIFRVEGGIGIKVRLTTEPL
jgi:hypothetical protein